VKAKAELKTDDLALRTVPPTPNSPQTTPTPSYTHEAPRSVIAYRRSIIGHTTKWKEQPSVAPAM
jgi:hypothetical protein